jgi:hypothetical protein
MGAWSPTILGNDTSCEVRERFFELYDNGEKSESISKIILKEQAENLKYDRTNIWLGLAMACWECKLLTSEILSEVKTIIDTKEDIEFNKELDADEKFLKQRQKNLETFYIKISTEKEKARKRKKVPIEVETIYLPGMCLSYKNANGKYVGIFLTKSEHFRNKGRLEFFFMDFETKNIPSIEEFINSKLYGLKKLGKEWGNREFLGNVTDIQYEKVSKNSFDSFVTQNLLTIGQLTSPDENKLSNNFRGRPLDLSDNIGTIKTIESIRKENMKLKLSDMTLGDLLQKIGKH